MFFSSPEKPANFVQVLSASSAGRDALYWQLAPVITASFGASIDLRKLMAYPIPRGKLFQVELLLRAITSFDLLIVLTGICARSIRDPAHEYGSKK